MICLSSVFFFLVFPTEGVSRSGSVVPVGRSLRFRVRFFVVGALVGGAAATGGEGGRWMPTGGGGKGVGSVAAASLGLCGRNCCVVGVES